jgi:ABC-type proline/glycine betaine transport system substrate-binding protein
VAGPPGSDQAKTNVIRIKDSVRSDLQFTKDMIGINPGSSDEDVIESLIKMFKQKKDWAIKSR